MTGLSVAVKKSRALKNLLALDKKLPKLMDKIFNKAMRIMVGNSGAGGASRQQQLILNNFRKKWATQKKFTPLTQETENQKTDRSEEFILVSDGTLMRAVRDTIRTKLVGDKLIAKVTVPNYGEYIQNGTPKMPPRPYFRLGTKQEEKFFYDLIDSLLTLELNKMGLRAKES